MASSNSDGRQKLVMGLGIVAILLFSANMLTALVKHIWPEHSTELVNVSTLEWESDGAETEVYTARFSDRPHRLIIKRRRFAPTVHVEVEVENDFDQELARLGRTIEIEAEKLTRELSLRIEEEDWHAAMESAKEALRQAERSLAREKVIRDVELVERVVQNQ